ncbi:MAG TPA: metallophosphoesterase [Capillimicrobium sp.]
MTRRLLAGATALGSAVLAYATLVEPRWLAVRRSELRLDRWPAALDGLRVAVISDLHAGAPQVDPAWIRRIVERANAQRPDLVVLLGDHIDGHHHLDDPVAPGAVAAALAGLRAPRGVIAVLGNHDWRTDGPGMAAALREHGITVLENTSTAAGAGLWVAGVGDASTRFADVARALGSVPDDDAAVLLLTHDPDVFPRVPDRPALTLAGHTHGAQVDLPLLRRAWIPSRFGARYAGGLVREDGRTMLVSAGVGTSGWPVRLGARPEVPVLTLRPA